jgi:hypothetical protein
MHFAAEAEGALGGAAVAPAPAPVVVPAAPVTAAPAAPVVAEPNADPNWLRPRLERERSSAQTALLKELGVTDAAQAKQIIAEANKRAEAERSASERLTAAEAARVQAEQQANEYRASLAVYAGQQMAALTPERRAVIEKRAGADPAAQISLIADFGPTWGIPVAPVVPAPIPAPGSSAPVGGAPPPPNPNPQPNHLATYEGLLKTNPVAAANYQLSHWAEIQQARTPRA